MVLADLAEIDDEMLTAQQCLRDDVRRSLQFLLREQEEGKSSREKGGDRESGRVGWGVCLGMGAGAGRGSMMYSEGGSGAGAGGQQSTDRGDDREKEYRARRENEGETDDTVEDDKDKDKEKDKGREEIKSISSELEKDLGTQVLGPSAHTDSVDHDPVLLARYPML
jgi:hypothetical protein